MLASHPAALRPHVDRAYDPPLPLRRLLYGVAAAFCLTPWASPPTALAVGVAIGLTHENPFHRVSRSAARLLLQACVVLLGFGMDLPAVLRAGAGGAAFAAGTIATTLALGWAIGRGLKIAPRVSAMISCGTAICGGSAIAAIGSVTGAAEAEMTVALGTVFVLNAVALYAFPPLGHALGLTQTQFGTWAGVAIHDVSSVVAAAARFGLPALQTATAVKLSRALWIVPISVAAAVAFPHRDRPDGDTGAADAGVRRRAVHVPWFIGLFLLASIARTTVPGVAAAAPALTHAATVGLTLTLFLIGASLSPKTLQSVGWRPLAQGVALWVFISTASLAAIVRFG